MIRLPHIAQRYPKELSGGQQQRVALARCMVYRPSIILMDEPLGALDKKLREHMQLEIKRIHRELGATIIYVTHDQEEAMTMSDRICLMNSGKIEQLGTPADLYFRPKTLFVADFLGESNLIEATVTSADDDMIDVTIGAGSVAAQAIANEAISAGDAIHIMIRPQNLTINKTQKADGIGAVVSDVMVTGSLTKIYMNAEGWSSQELVAAFPTRLNGDHYQIGDKVSLSWKGQTRLRLAARGLRNECAVCIPKSAAMPIWVGHMMKVAPLIALLLAFLVYPVGQLLSLSFFNDGALSLASYRQLFASPLYLNVLWITLKIRLRRRHLQSSSAIRWPI